MRIDLKKVLLTGTAIVAVTTFVPVKARAATVTLTTDDTWAEDADQTSADVGSAAAGDNASLDGNVLTITNDQTADDGGGLNTFTIGNIGDAVGGGDVLILQDATGTTNQFVVNINAVGASALPTDFSVLSADGSGQNVNVGITGVLRLLGNLNIDNNGATTAGTVSTTVGGAVTVGGVTNITAGTFGASHASLTLNGAGVNTFTGGIVLTDNPTSDAALIVSGTAAQTVNGTIDGGGAGQGMLIINNTFGGTGVTFNGNIGATQALDEIDLLGTNTKIFNGTVDANLILFAAAGTARFNDDVNATSTGLINFNGNAGTVILGDGANVGGNIDDTSSAGNGTLTLLSAGANTSTISGDVGSTFALDAININGTGDTVFNGTVDAGDTVFNAAGTATFNGDVNATSGGTIDFNGNAGTVILGDGFDISGDVDDTGSAGNGTLSLLSAGASSSTINGAVGATNALGLISIDGNGTTDFTSTVNADDIDFNAAGTLNFADDVISDDIDFNGFAGITNFADNADYAGDIVDTSGGDFGTVNFAGTSNVTPVGGTTGSLGTAGNGIAAVNVNGGAGEIVTVAGTIVATNINIDGAGGALTANGDVTGAVNFGADGVLNTGDGITVTGNITNTTTGEGTLNINDTGTGTDIDGTVGIGGGGELAAVNMTGAGGDVLFGDDVATVTFTMNGAASNARLRGDLTTSGAITGGAGAQTIAINSNDSVITHTGDITGIESIEVNTANFLELAGVGNVVGGTINLAADGAVLTVSGAKTVSSAITGTAGTQTVNATNDVVLTGALTDIESVTVNAGNTLTLSGGLNDGGTESDITLTGAGAQVTVTAGTVNAAVTGDGSGQTLQVNGGTVEGAVAMGGGADTIGLGGGQINNTIDGGTGTDDIQLTANATLANAVSNVESADLNGNLLTLSAAMTGLTGGIDVDGGQIDVVDGSGSFDGAVSDSSGGGFLVFGSGAAGVFNLSNTIDDVNLTVANGSTLSTNGNILGGGGALADISIDTASIFNVQDNVTSNGILTNSGTIDISNALTGNPGTPTLTVDSIAGAPTGSFIFELNRTGAVLTNGSINVAGGGAIDLSAADIQFRLNAGSQSLIGGNLFILETGAASVALSANQTAGVDNSFVYDYFLSDDGFGNLNLLVAASPDLEDAATTDNNFQVAKAILEGLAGSTDPEIIAIQNALANTGSSKTFNNILESIQPTVDGSSYVAALEVSNDTLDLTDERLALLRTGSGATGISAGDSDDDMGAWMQVFGHKAQQDENEGIDGYDADTWGGAVGIDGNLSENAVLGLAFSYGNTDASSDNINQTDTEIDSYQATLYGSYNFDPATFFNAMLAYGWNDVETVRHNVGLLGLDANGEFDASQITAQARVGRDYDVGGGMTLTPDLLAHWVNYDPDSYTETGAGGANLNVEGDTVNLVELGAGLAAGWNIENGNGSSFRPEIHAGYRYAVVNDRLEDTSSFTAGGGTFATQGPEPDRSRVNVGAAVKLETADDWNLTAGYDYSWRENYTSNSGYLRAGLKF